MNDDTNVAGDIQNFNADGTPIVAETLTPEAIAALQEANKKLYARAKTAEGFVQDSTGKWVKKEKPSVPTEIINNSPKPLDILRDDAFKLYREGYTEEEIDIILQNGGRKILENQSHPLTLGLKAAKEQRKAEEAASAAGGGTGFSDVNEKISLEQLKGMSAKEMEKLLPKAPNQ